MKNEVEKAIWLSFDLGIGGDYPGLYKWLDNHKAIECGNNLAFLKYPIDTSKENEIPTVIKNDIKKTVKVRPGDRMYIVRREKSGTSSAIRGEFIFGKRKSKPWEGYGDFESDSSEEGE